MRTSPLHRQTTEDWLFGGRHAPTGVAALDIGDDWVHVEDLDGYSATTQRSPRFRATPASEYASIATWSGAD